MRSLLFKVACSSFVFLWVAAASVQLEITIENLQPADGFFFTPVWLGFHDGSFDVQTVGQSASLFPGLEEIAEGGDTSIFSANFQSVVGRFDRTVAAVGGAAAGPFDPGESVTTVLNVPNRAANRYLSYASMVIPSNDAFFGNGNPMAIEVFDSLGNFRGPRTITITGDNVYDAGTEVNDGMGAAFSTLGGTSSDEFGNIMLHAGLDNFLGTNTAAGTTIMSSLNGAVPLARISLRQVPEPAAASWLGSAAWVLLGRRWRG